MLTTYRWRREQQWHKQDSVILLFLWYRKLSESFLLFFFHIAQLILSLMLFQASMHSKKWSLLQELTRDIHTHSNKAQVLAELANCIATGNVSLIDIFWIIVKVLLLCNMKTEHIDMSVLRHLIYKIGMI